MTTGDNGKMNGPRLYPFLAAIAIITGLVLIVLAAIATDALITLIAGVIVLGLIAIGLATIGVKLFSRYTDAVLKRKSLEYEHVQNMAKLGYLPTGGKYLPMRAEIAAPKSSNADRPGSQIQFNANDLRTSSVDLLLFSRRLLGDESNRIASGPECAMAGITGYSGRTWDKMIHEYLEPRYGVAAVRGPIENGGGVYVPSEIGTVKQLYDMIVRNSAVEALPEMVKR